MQFGKRHCWLLILILGPIAAAAQAHDFAGMCQRCHLGTTGSGSMIFVEDVDELCRQCHPVAKSNSHPSGMRVDRALPEAFKLDIQGRLTCTTCHNPCLEATAENPHLLVHYDDPGSFCTACHPDPSQCIGVGEGIFDLTHAKAWTPPEGEALLDEVSVDCLGCHDDGGRDLAVGAALHPSVSGAASLDAIHASHPVGQDYAAIAETNLELRSIDDLSPLISLREGKVGCASCHNPYSAERNFLVFSNSASSLCRECHLI